MGFRRSNTCLGLQERAQEHIDSSLLQRQQNYPEIETDPGKERWHAAVLESVSSAAKLAEARGDYFKAVEIYGDAINSLIASAPPLASKTADMHGQARLQIRLGRVYVLLNKIHEAKHVLKRAGDVVFSQLGDRHIIAAELYHLGLLCNHEGWYMDAHECYTTGT